MKADLIREIYRMLLVFLFILLYVYTGTDKLIGFGDWKEAVEKQVFPDIFTWPIAIGVPLVELTIVVLLFWPEKRILGLYLATGLILVFTIYTGLGAANVFEQRPCGCAGLFRTWKWSEHFWFNFDFLMAGIVALIDYRWKTQERLATVMI